MLTPYKKALFRFFNLHLALKAIGGLVFVWVFANAYSVLDPADYAYRDDGVITLSHARNWVDFGHIGVNPSGERIEAYSAPLQFFIYAAVYRVTGMGWHRFMDMQTWICTFLLGAIFIGFFRRNYLLGFFLTWGSALLLAHNFNFIGWHGSGMENPWHSVFLLWAVYAFWRMWTVQKVSWGWLWPVLLAGLVRHESLYHLLPLLGLFLWWMHRETERKKAWYWAMALLGLWGMVQLWRVFYFGSLYPHSGVVQHISLGDHLLGIWEGEAKVRWWSKAAALIFSVHGLYLLLVLLPLFPYLKMNREGKWVFMAALSLCATAYFHPLMFGNARLDWTRTTTFAPVFVALALSQGIVSLKWLEHWRPLLLVVPALLFFFRTVHPPYVEAPRTLCCAIDKYQEIEDLADQFSRENNLHRLQVATPDLGKISYAKKFNITDLGLLGSRLLATMEGSHHTDLIADYLFEFVQPDVIEFHHYWIHLYGRVWSDSRFAEQYELVRQKPADPRANDAYPELKMGIFVRKALKKESGSPEYQLIQDLKSDLSTDRLARELRLAVRQSDPGAHQYVVRTAWRFLPEFRKQGQEKELVALFGQTPSREYDQALLQSAHLHGWWKPMYEFIGGTFSDAHRLKVERHLGKGAQMVHERNRFRFYLHPDHRLGVAILGPVSADYAPQIMLHAFPTDKSTVSNPWGAHFLDFKLHPDSARWSGNEAFWEIPLPKTSLEAVIVGQTEGDVRLWTQRIPWPFSEK